MTALREIKLLRELEDPHIVRLLDVFPHKGNLALVSKGFWLPCMILLTWFPSSCCACMQWLRQPSCISAALHAGPAPVCHCLVMLLQDVLLLMLHACNGFRRSLPHQSSSCMEILCAKIAEVS